MRSTLHKALIKTFVWTSQRTRTGGGRWEGWSRKAGLPFKKRRSEHETSAGAVAIRIGLALLVSLQALSMLIGFHRETGLVRGGGGIISQQHRRIKRDLRELAFSHICYK